ncbi:MAG TPA: cytochrome c [Saprospiraceae bacterium]|nr:cytochrome c [Saprospiraceae bacterium]
MMKHTTAYLMLACLGTLIACSPAGNNRRGHEFMPDMVHTTGYEANLFDYYYYNRWGTEEEYKKLVMPRTSVHGTVARGDVSLAYAADPAARMADMDNFEGIAEGSIAYTPNGSVPYYYADTEEERSRAMKEIVQNPFPITQEGLDRGKILYNIYCGICHGEKGDGQGYLVRDADPVKGIPAGVYPAAPANFLLDTFVHASTGRFYHAIMRGKNVMGSYADKLSYLERWEVIHYIRSLEAKSKNLVYSSTLNTFNKEAVSWDILEAEIRKNATVMGKDSIGHEPAVDHHQGEIQHNTDVHK